MALIRIITDGGGRHGFGNLRRSATLGNAFKAAGHAVRVDALSEEGRHLLPTCPADEGEADLWLLDLPYEGDAVVCAARVRGRAVAALDFAGRESPDLVISIFARGTAPEGARHLAGMEYAIIRPEIATLAPAAPGNGVIVIIGGGESDGLGERVALHLHGQGCQVTLVDGPLAAVTRPLPAQIARASAPPDLAERMAASAWGVTGAGGTLLEMLCLGKAVHVVPRTSFEEALAKTIERQSAVLGVGVATLNPPSDTQRERVARTAGTLVDGRGALRIVRAVTGLL